jgi:nucleoside-diphosphate-sugar epimerase
MNILIGNTGLIGRTIKDNIKFDLEFNSSNIESIKSYDINNSDIYLSCLPATKWMVNQDPIKDYKNLTHIYNLISKFNFNKIILFSTIDVYCDSPLLANEDYRPPINSINYGSNRLLFELLINSLKSNLTQIFRLPALFSNRIKKNILFDLLNNNNIDKINFNSKYQWLNLKDLYKFIVDFQNQNGIINVFPEPVESIDILKLFDIDENNINFPNDRIIYNYTTKYTNNGYIKSKEESIEDIKNFINEYRNNSVSV